MRLLGHDCSSRSHSEDCNILCHNSPGHLSFACFQASVGLCIVARTPCRSANASSACGITRYISTKPSQLSGAARMH